MAPGAWLRLHHLASYTVPSCSTTSPVSQSRDAVQTAVPSQASAICCHGPYADAPGFWFCVHHEACHSEPSYATRSPAV